MSKSSEEIWDKVQLYSKFNNGICKRMLDKTLEKVLLSGDADLILMTAKDIDDEELFQQFEIGLINLRNPLLIYLFAKYINKSNLDLLYNEVINLGDEKYIKLFDELITKQTSEDRIVLKKKK